MTRWQNKGVCKILLVTRYSLCFVWDLTRPPSPGLCHRWPSFSIFSMSFLSSLLRVEVFLTMSLLLLWHMIMAPSQVCRPAWVWDETSYVSHYFLCICWFPVQISPGPFKPASQLSLRFLLSQVTISFPLCNEFPISRFSLECSSNLPNYVRLGSVLKSF